jgi:hypothetical protein
LLLLAAIGLALSYGVCHLAGWREYTSILCGMPPGGGIGAATASLLGLIYVSAYLGCYLLAPALALGAILWLLLSRLGR